MEHAEARELLELAALEPGGFDRLAAGDRPDAAALAGHVAGCLECAAEMERLRRASAVIRDAVRSAPPPELRERTLAFVAAVGRPRGASAGPAGALPALATGTGKADTAGSKRQTRMWAAALAAAVVLAVVGTSLYVAGSRDAQIQTQATQIAALAKVATWSHRIDGQPDAQYVELDSGPGAAGVEGSLAFSPTTKELVVLAQGLAQPPAGMQYRCWVEIDGGRRRIGQMFFGGDVAFWVGPVEEISGAGPGTLFGITLVPSDGDSLTGDPILVGEL